MIRDPLICDGCDQPMLATDGPAALLGICRACMREVLRLAHAEELIPILDDNLLERMYALPAREPR
jgi:hypothetical protein